MKCLIVAAGQGSRMRDHGDSKPLIEIDGIPIIERVILNARKGGIDDFYVVTGYRGTKVRSFLDELSERENITINHITNKTKNGSLTLSFPSQIWSTCNNSVCKS